MEKFQIKRETKSTKSSSSEITEKQRLIFIIEKYQSSSRFGDFVRKNLKVNYTHETLQKKSLSTLKDILEKIRLNLDNKNLDKFYELMLRTSTLTFEKLVCNFADIEGFTDNLLDSEAFQDCWARYKIEKTFPRVSPEVQMSFIVLQTLAVTYKLNEVKNNQKKSIEMDEFERSAHVMNEPDEVVITNISNSP